MRILFSCGLALVMLAGCGSDGSSSNASGGGGGGAAVVVQDSAQVRFLYEADWKDHLASTCAWISEYRVEFGGSPLPVTVPIDVTADALGDYVRLASGTYKDDNVLHLFTCNQSQTSKQTKQDYGRFGTDLAFETAKRYTVTLGGSAATVAEDP